APDPRLAGVLTPEAKSDQAGGDGNCNQGENLGGDRLDERHRAQRPLPPGLQYCWSKQWPRHESEALLEKRPIIIVLFVSLFVDMLHNHPLSNSPPLHEPKAVPVKPA